MMQDFDYSTSSNKNIMYDGNDQADKIEKEFYVAVADSSVHNVVFGTYNRFVSFNY